MIISYDTCGSKVIRFLLLWQHLVGIVKQQAYKNVNNLKMIDETKLNCLNLDACLKKARQSDTPNQCLQHMDMPTAQGICNGTTLLLHRSLSTFIYIIV